VPVVAELGRQNLIKSDVLPDGVKRKRGRPKGYPKSGGRAPGQPTKSTYDIREMVCKALNMVGGEKYFARQAEKNPAAFMALVGKVMPLQVQASGGGAMLLEQLALAAQALRERAQIAPPALGDRVIEHVPVYKDSVVDGSGDGYGSAAEDKHKQDQ
jgi:hypothetical protein